MTQEELEKRIRENIAKVEEEINCLPFDPEVSDVLRYQTLMGKMVAYHRTLRYFCSPPKPVDSAEEDVLYD